MPLLTNYPCKYPLLILGCLILTSPLSGCFLIDEGNRAPTSQLSSILPYSQVGKYRVGLDRLVISLDPPLELSTWYPADGNQNLDKSVEYAYEVKFTEPLGTMTVATYDGHATVGVPMDELDAPYPIVILSPGFSIRPEAYAWLAEHLASYGFVVLSPDHHERLDPDKQLWRSAITRPQELQAILTSLEQDVGEIGDLAGLIDLEKVAVVGHSYGGYTALITAGARFDTDSFRQLCEGVQGTDEPGAWLCERLLPHMEEMADLAGLDSVPEGLWPAQAIERVDAIVPIAGDALFFGQPGLAEITVPVLAIGGTADEDSPFAWGTEPTYEFTSSKRKSMVGLISAGHMIFTGPCEKSPWHLKVFSGEFCADPSWDRDDAHTITKHFVTAFLQAELKEDEDAVPGLLLDETGIPNLDYQVVGY